MTRIQIERGVIVVATTRRSGMGGRERSLTFLLGLNLTAAALLLAGCANPRSSEMNCANNEKQILLASIAYCQDYDEKFPPTLQHKPGISWMQALFPYIKSVGTFKCPDDTGTKISWRGDPLANPFQAAPSFHTSYMANYQLGGTAGVNIAVMNAPASTVYLAEGGTQAGTGNPSLTGGITAASTAKDGAWILQDPGRNANGGHARLAWSSDPNWGGPSLRHADHTRTNVGFADGHVKLMDGSWYYSNTPWLDPRRGGPVAGYGPVPASTTVIVAPPFHTATSTTVHPGYLQELAPGP